MTTVRSVRRHRTRLEDSWRPTGDGVRVLRWLARCGCGWSDGWFQTRTEAATSAEEHRRVAALASRAGIPERLYGP